MKSSCRDPTLPDPSWPRFGERLKFLPVAWVLFVIAGLWYIYTFHHCVPLIRSSATFQTGWIELSIFNLLTIAILSCYWCSIRQHPGTVPDKEHTSNDADKEQIAWEKSSKGPPTTDTKEKKKSGDRRNCKWCDKFKPDRTHHCRVCRMCILKMDHHCPWIYNCVGFHNHKYFFLLVMYVVLTLHFIMWTMLETVISRSRDDQTPFMELYCLWLGESVTALFGFVFTTFFFFHVYLMLESLTTIEFCEKSTNSFRSNPRPFDKGLLGNIKAVLGDNVLLWFLPFSPPSGDGMHFTAEDTPLQPKAKGNKSYQQYDYAEPQGMDVAQSVLNARSGSSPPGCSDRGVGRGSASDGSGATSPARSDAESPPDTRAPPGTPGWTL